jgi:hypothetical protein
VYTVHAVLCFAVSFPVEESGVCGEHLIDLGLIFNRPRSFFLQVAYLTISSVERLASYPAVGYNYGVENDFDPNKGMNL